MVIDAREERAISLKETAAILSVSRPTLLKLLDERKLKSVRVSPGRRAVLRSELDRYLASLTAE